MPKIKETPSMFYHRMVSEYRGLLRTDNSALYCLVCEAQLKAKQVSEVKQHLNTTKHITILQKTGRPEQKNAQALATGGEQRYV